MHFIDEFLKQVNEKRDAVALTDHEGKRNLTYGQLEELSNKIAGKLTAQGVGEGKTVIILLPRIAEYIAAEIALFKIGAVAVPLIPEYPKDRVEYIKKDSGSALTITEDFFEDLDKIFNEGFRPCAFSDDTRGMILYTSGSTGRPKGVVYTRSNVDAQVIRKIGSVKDLTPLIFAASATMSFCVAVTEYFRALAIGGQVHILSNETRSDARRLSDYYKDHQITSGFISPRILKVFECKSKYLRRVFTIGEKVVNIYSSDFEIINAYGQSETVGGITEFFIDKAYDNTPIGKPLTGVEIIVADANGDPVEEGCEGEICFIGNFPCEYNNLKEQTDKVFRKLSDGRIFIRSGDIGKMLPDGNLLYLNRNDWMIKIHGQRVEPGEIESVMNSVEGITGSIVKAFENEDGTMLLCGFYTEKESVDRETIVATLKAKLPSYMIPGVFVKMDAFPVNANGKIDRRSIERPDLSRLTVTYEKPEGQTEETISLAMEKLLGIDRVGRNDNFLQLGGNSLNAVELCSICNMKGLAPQIVMIGQTPKRIAELISENSFYPKPKLRVSKKLKKSYPLSKSQRYQYELCKRQGKTIDCIDMVYFFKLDEDIDILRLRASVEDAVNAHVIYKSHIDIENAQLIVDDSFYKVEDVRLSDPSFETYRHNIYKHIHALKTEPLCEAKLLHIEDGRRYLYIRLCHLVYDGKTLRNLLGEISSRYNGEPFEAEEATIFDLIAREGLIQEDAGLFKKADEVFASNYSGLKSPGLFGAEKKYLTGVSKKILEEESKAEIDDYLKNNGISVLTLFQAAAEITIGRMFGQKDFCYMNIHDGRGDQLLDASHGVFAKPVFMRAGVGKYDNMKKYFIELEEQYQKLVYYDIFDTFEIVRKYPEIMSGVTFNFRDMQGVVLRLEEKLLFSDFLDEINAAYKPFTDFDLIINRYPKGYGYLVTIASTKVSEEFANEFMESLTEALMEILHKG